jgi:hypothetical protein
LIGTALTDIIHVSPSILNAYQALWQQKQPSWKKKVWMDDFKFKAQILGLEPMSEPALAGQFVHHACWGGGKDLPELGKYIVHPDIPRVVNEACGFSEGDGGVPEVPFVMQFPKLKARLSGRCDVLYDDRTIEGKSTQGHWQELRPGVDKYVALPQTLAYATYFGVPCEIYIIHIDIKKPRSRPKGTAGIIEFADGPGSPVVKAVVHPTEETRKNLDVWMKATVEYIAKDEEMLAHCLEKGKREIRF